LSSHYRWLEARKIANRGRLDVERVEKVLRLSGFPSFLEPSPKLDGSREDPSFVVRREQS
jgi:hypothetical protein